MKESNAKGKKLPIEKYKVPTIFYGVKTGIYGYSEEEGKKIIDALKQNGAEIAIYIPALGGNILAKSNKNPENVLSKRSKSESQMKNR